jgi:hypothetical protein
MTDQHPITPSFEVIREWCAHPNEHETYDQFWHHIATKAAQWGADQEMEACCEWFQEEYKIEPGAKYVLKRLRNHRRPKPPSLKVSALESLEEIVKLAEMFVPLAFVDGSRYQIMQSNRMQKLSARAENIRKALEALPND